MSYALSSVARVSKWLDRGVKITLVIAGMIFVAHTIESCVNRTSRNTDKWFIGGNQ